MSEEPEVVETVEAEAPPPEPEIAPEVIEQARKYGWKGEDEWQGAPPKGGFKRPDEYLDLPQVQNRILREDIDALRKSQEKRDRETADQLARMDRMHQETERRRAEQHKVEIERIKAEQRRAVKEGDEDRYEALEKERERLGDAPKVERQQDPAGEPQDINAWIASRPADHWYHDPVARQVSIALYQEATVRGIVGAEHKFNFVEKRIREELPHKFSEAKPARPPKVDGGGLGLGGGKRLYDKLPPDAKAAAKRAVAENLYPDGEAYAKFYFEQEDA